ncbi:transcriptional regulator [Lachnospiraceae bacterium KM106-2]|nr:transcriptional regulator [Lachnospiraceae bacterium KM106-2]
MTLKDIAEEAGVSAVTVSNVINGKHKKVSQDTIDRVNQIIEKYNFIPNASARSLAIKSSRIIGVIIPNVRKDDNILTSPYDAEIIGIIERVIREKGYYLMFRCASNYHEVCNILKMWNVDGAIISGIGKEYIDYLEEHLTMPILYLDCNTDDERILRVDTNDYKGGFLATNYLIKNGHRKIAFCGPDLSVDSGVLKNRYIGYQDALSNAEIPFNPDYIFAGDVTYEQGLKIGTFLSKGNTDITAVFACADIIAFGIMDGFRANGKKIPDDCSIIGYDNLSICRYTTPKLTTIGQDIVKKGEYASNLLIDIIEGQKTEKRRTLLDVHIIERQTVKKRN